MAFKTALTKIVTERMIEGYSQKYTEHYTDMFCNFEIGKRRFGKPEVDFVFTIPITFYPECSETLNISLTNLIRYSEFKDHISIRGTRRMAIDFPTFKAFYQPACDGIVRGMKKMFLSPKVNGVDTILMVGGFSESEVLQEKVQEAFPQCKIIVPEDAGVAVVYGAVLFGYRRSIFANNCQT